MSGGDKPQASTALSIADKDVVHRAEAIAGKI
jgi:hypothetical protein